MNRIAKLERLLEAEPGDTFVLYSLGQEHAKAGRYEEAIGWYDRCLVVDPAYSYAYYHKARALQASGDVAAAVEVLQAGLEAAKAARDQKAVSEIGGFLDLLT